MLTALALLVTSVSQSPAPPRPNILLAISDDQSWMHAGANGDAAVATPAFDAVARAGVRFEHAFVASPSCTPSRGALLTGQAMWRLGRGGVLHGSLPTELPVYPLLLRDDGYFVGYTGKGWGPGNVMASGRSERPEGQRFDARKLQEAPRGMSRNDYAANFADFLAARPADAPFCFWFGASEPHRVYGPAESNRATPRRPAFLPDAPQIRDDLEAYAREIEHFDAQLARMLALLEEAGELDNTIVVVTSDNGMPFPRAKTTLYDGGTRVPLAISWPAAVPGGRVLTDFASLTDLAPTLLEAAGVTVPAAMSGRSLLAVLASEEGGRVDPTRDHVVVGVEQHVPCRAGFVGYPARALRTDRWLYVRNYEPERWPAGDPPPFEVTPGRVYADIDGGPTKDWLLAHAGEPALAAYFELACAQRPAEELYDLDGDPEQLRNLAAEPELAAERERLAAELSAILARTGDPRSKGEAPWERYPVHAGYLKDNDAFQRSRSDSDD